MQQQQLRIASLLTEDNPETFNGVSAVSESTPLKRAFTLCFPPLCCLRRSLSFCCFPFHTRCSSKLFFVLPDFTRSSLNPFYHDENHSKLTRKYDVAWLNPCTLFLSAQMTINVQYCFSFSTLYTSPKLTKASPYENLLTSSRRTGRK